jgi:uncharacterized protein involved in exopolysaccharide biosynthesis
MSNHTKSFDIDLASFFKMLLRNWILIFGISAIFFLSAVVISLNLQNKYISKSILVSVDSSDQGGVNSLGSLAAVAGLGISSSSGSKADEGIEIIKSFDFFRELDAKIELSKDLLAATKWNEQTNKIIYNKQVFDFEKKSWANSPPFNNSQKRLLTAYEEYLDILTISKDSQTGFIILSIEFISPFLAESWIKEIVTLINETAREKELERTEKSIEYLYEQISQSYLSEVKQSLSNLVENQTEKAMLAKASPEYFFRVLNEPYAPIRKSWPPRLLIVILSSIMGFLAACAYILMREYLKQK